MALSHKDVDGIKNVIGKMSIYVQTANVDIARLKLEILSLKNHVQNLEHTVNDLRSNSSSSSSSSGSGDSIENLSQTQTQSPSNVKTVGGGGSLDTNSALEQLSQLTSGMGGNGGNSARVPM
jgi:hypothetical protein